MDYDNLVLLYDGVLDKTISVTDLDSKEAIKNGGSARYSVVLWTSALPAGQRAAIQGGPGRWTLAHLDSWSHGSPRR